MIQYHAPIGFLVLIEPPLVHALAAKQRKVAGFYGSMKANKYIFLILFLASCSTTKTVFKERIITDSVALHELELAKRTIETQERLNQELKADSQAVFIQYADADTIYVNKVSIDRSGAIQAEGRLRSVSITNSSLLTALSRSQRTIDSFSHLQRRDSIVYRTQTKIVYREVKRRNWWWLWLALGLIAGWAARHNWPRVRTWVGTIKSLR